MSFITSAVAYGQATPPPPTTPTKRPSAAEPAAVSPPSVPGLEPRALRVFALQVALDRAGFSSGEIDAANGGNTQRALRGFQQTNGLPATGELDARTVTMLGAAFQNPTATYSITAEDVAGPFAESIPADMMKKSELKALSYASIIELLAERFHVAPNLLKRLNPSAKFAAGEIITVPNVEPFLIAGNAPAATAGRGRGAARAGRGDAGVANDVGRASTSRGEATAPPSPATAVKGSAGLVITVTDRTKTLIVQNAEGDIVFQAPVTVGSQKDPLPVGEWKVNGVSRNPTFNYNPDLFWDANPSHAKAKIAPGPNNPVGVVWIDLSKEHYGIHGTPEPSRIGHTESHGCIRLTNWDVSKLATMVAPGTKVILR